MTENLMRKELKEWNISGKPFNKWAERVGFVLGDGLIATRRNIQPHLTKSPSRGWHMLLRPEISNDYRQKTKILLDAIGIFDAEFHPYGEEVNFRRLPDIGISTIVDLMMQWPLASRSGWSRHNIPDFMARVAYHQPELMMDLVLLDNGGKPRKRSWNAHFGFSTLLQGRNQGYSGDRSMFQKKSGLQIHWIEDKEGLHEPIYTLALKLGEEIVAATEVRRLKSGS